jgi:hypothetical protein
MLFDYNYATYYGPISKPDIDIGQPDMIKQIRFAVIVYVLQLISGIHINIRCNFVTDPDIRPVLVDALLN